MRCTLPVLADLQDERVQEHDRIDVIQRPRLPGTDIVHHRVGDLRDQIAADLNAVELLQEPLDLPGRQPPRIQGQDLLVEPLKAPLALADQLRLEAAVPIPWACGPEPARCR